MAFSMFKSGFRGVMTAVFAIVMLSTGCSDNTVTPEVEQAGVSGSVTIDGKPIPVDSLVVFVNEEHGLTLASPVDSLGKFALTPADPRLGVPAGRYRVAIKPPTAAETPASQGSADYTKMMQAPASAVPDKATDDSPIPEKFRDANTSGLTFQVKAGPNDFPMDLSKL